MSTTRLSTPQPARCPTPTVKAITLEYLIVARPDLDSAEKFLNDFGLVTVEKSLTRLLLRSCDSKPWCYEVIRSEHAAFIGFGLGVSSEQDLATVAALPGAGTIEEMDEVGGGRRVSLQDPNGFRVDAVFGRESVEPLAPRSTPPRNSGNHLERINASLRTATAPADILKLGHVVFETADFQAVCRFYTEHFGFIPSDTQILPDGSPAVTFMRLDLGDTPADHHTLALAQTFRAAYSHSAFEVADIDAVGMGQQHLRNQGWTHAWGMGRHILGSQIFDYWSDPSGAHHEHYTDGDVFTANQPPGVHPFSAEAMAQWGQVMPASFIKPPLSLATVRDLLINLWRVPDLTLKKLITIARLAS